MKQIFGERKQKTNYTKKQRKQTTTTTTTKTDSLSNSIS